MTQDKYFNPAILLPYQRNFIFINGVRGIGKSYGIIKMLIKHALTKNIEFVYLVRTQDDKKSGALKKGLSKVIKNEYSEIEFHTENDYIKYEKDKDWVPLGYCIALSEAVKIKRNSYPNVKYIFFDEYCLEDSQRKSYVNGYKEPDLLLNLYHTIDREQDKVICFLAANNINFYNPYHIHPAFNIPNPKEKRLWMSENVLFYNAPRSKELAKANESNKFLRMIKNTEYSNYAQEGEYSDTNDDFIDDKIQGRYFCTLKYNNEFYGIYISFNSGLGYVTDKIDKSNPNVFALTAESHTKNTVLLTHYRQRTLKVIADLYKIGNLKFINHQVKAKATPAIRLLL